MDAMAAATGHFMRIIHQLTDRSQLPHGAPLPEGPLDALLVLKHEGHDQIDHEVEAGGDEREVDEAEAHLLGLDVEVFTPPCANAKSVTLEIGLDAIDHASRGDLFSRFVPMTQCRQRRCPQYMFFSSINAWLRAALSTVSPR